MMHECYRYNVLHTVLLGASYDGIRELERAKTTPPVPTTIRITYTKENSMSKIDNLLAQAKHIENLVEKELAKTAEFGVDEYEDDTVIAFEYQFNPGGIFYSYVMIKVNGHWYTSGPRSAGKAWTWDELVEWWAKGKRRQAFIVGQWDEL
jgi:hypothetical protein